MASGGAYDPAAARAQGEKQLPCSVCERKVACGLRARRVTCGSCKFRDYLQTGRLDNSDATTASRSNDTVTNSAGLTYDSCSDKTQALSANNAYDSIYASNSNAAKLDSLTEAANYKPASLSNDTVTNSAGHTYDSSSDKTQALSANNAYDFTYASNSSDAKLDSFTEAANYNPAGDCQMLQYLQEAHSDLKVAFEAEQVGRIKAERDAACLRQDVAILEEALDRASQPALPAEFLRRVRRKVMQAIDGLELEQIPE